MIAYGWDQFYRGYKARAQTRQIMRKYRVRTWWPRPR